MSGTPTLVLMVITDDQEHYARAAEVLCRAAAGLNMEGIAVTVRFDHEDEYELEELNTGDDDE